jgi:vancomycin resistance protein YoaR
VAFEAGAVVTSAAVPGRAVDVEAAADAVEDAFFGDASAELPLAEVSLPTTEVQPAVTDDEVERAVTEFAEPAMSGPVTVVAGDETAALEPELIGSALTMTPGEDGTLAPALDGAALAAAAEDVLAEIGQQGRDATIRIQGGRPVVIPAETGRGVVPDALSAAVLPALTAVGDARTATVELTEVEPKLTTEGAEQLGVEEVVAEWSTYFPHADYRNQNIGLAADRIDNTLLLPGETFSLNDLVGERTGANGFAEGWTIDGGRLKKDFGGGVSQVATTTYHAAFLAGLEDVYHQPHSIYFDRYPVGQEATVSWGNFDMSFKNDTPYGVLVDTAFTPSSADSRGLLTVKIWSTTHFRVETSVSGRSNVTSPPTVYDTNVECQAESGWEGFSITSYRKVWTPDGTLVKDEADPWTYRPNPTVVCGPKP